MGLLLPNKTPPNLSCKLCQNQYPVLAGATLLVVREALIGCTLSEAALRQAVQDSGSGTPTPGGLEECMAEQAVLNAVVALLDAGGFG